MKALVTILLFTILIPAANAKDKIHALYIPLADHYPGLIAHHKYAGQMTKAEYTVEQMKSWPALEGKFLSGQADIAFIISPMAMNMFSKSQDFHWVSLIHRDGNALAVNELFAKDLDLAEHRIDRKPNNKFAKIAKIWKSKSGAASIVGVPSLYATHTAVIYKYLKDNGATLAIGKGEGDVIAKAVAPPKSPSFIKNLGESGKAASFEQSLPWADIVETEGFGKVVWYSKDIMKWPKGHVECIIIASDKAIKEKPEALREVINAIHQAGRYIDLAREKGGSSLIEIANVINSKYIGLHTVVSIEKSLNWDLGVINYSNLNIDKAGLKQIMDLSVEAGIIKQGIDIDAFANDSFSTTLTEVH